MKVSVLWSGLVLLLAAVLLLSLAAGRYPVPIGHVAAILAAPVFDITPSWSPAEALVVRTVRLPRLLTAGLAGAGLALCGAVLQGIFRNPLVGPQTIGVSSGAALGGVVAIMLLGFGWPVAGGAFLGAVLALLAVLAIHDGRGLSAVLTLVLAGVVVSAFCGAMVSFATYVADPETKLPGLVFWLMGSFATATWPKLGLLALCSLPAGALMLAMRWRINILSLGDEEARSLGVHPARDRLILFGAICALVAAQVSVSGAIGWVGLVIPNLCRIAMGADHRRLLPASALLGASFLMLADTLARSVTAAEVPVGIVTALVGTPVFAWLLHRAAGGRQA
ncbi:iron ABC transporter permease [Rhodovarius crocodyli]|uniref:Iron ABC transporter permease n=1 Tax=Rhodovarius crocodyli TaxID=1979269 RepID=A0A437LXB9_9PROT|nr:iron ABC transporter permease [Rhodovarius crocodyli]RVT89987.1 iron ABC transporter permease [Rhodovarius crocodyli]